MSKVNFKQKQKKLREQRVRQTGWSEGTWDCSFSDSNEVLQSDEAESPKGVSQAVFDERPKAREKIKKKLEAARHKPDPSVPAEKLSDYFPFNRILDFKESKLLQFIQKCLLLHGQTFWR